MPTSTHIVRLSKRFRRLRRIVVAHVALLCLLTTVHAVTFGDQVFSSQAEEQLVCLKICAVGSPCDPDVCANPPAVTTVEVTGVSFTSASLSGNVTTDGGDTVTERGAVLATHASPTNADTVFTATTAGTGAFSVSLTALSEGTTYFVRAYALNAIDTSYGAVTSFTTLASSGEAPSVGTTVNGGGSRPIDTRPLSAFLLPGHPVQNRAVIAIDQLYNSANGTSVAVMRNEPVTVSFNRITLFGTTNIRSGSVFFNSPDGTSIGSAFADDQGVWQWTYPLMLPDGTHSLSLTAAHTERPDISASLDYTFSVNTRDAVVSEPVETIPDTVYEAPDDSGTTAEEDLPEGIETITSLPPLAVGIDVSDDGDPANGIDFRIHVVNQRPDVPKDARMTLILIDSEGNRLFEEQRDIRVNRELTIDARAVTPSSLPPGQYVVHVIFDTDEDAVSASHILTVEAPYMVETPFIRLQTSSAARSVELAIVIIAISSAGFMLLLRREYVQFRRFPQKFTDRDLLGSNMIR